MFKAVIFDFNGTLFFDNDKHMKEWSAVSMRLRGHPITDKELHLHVNGKCNEQIIDWLMPGLSKQENKKYSLLKESYYRTFCKEDTERFHLVKGAENFFDSLKEKQIPFTIASASIWENIEFFIQSFHLNHWIPTSQFVYDDGNYEDKKMMFLDAAKKLNTDIKDILIIEDSISGIEKAYEAGCRNIWVMDSSNQSDYLKKLPGVKKIIQDFDNLIE